MKVLLVGNKGLIGSSIEKSLKDNNMHYVIYKRSDKLYSINDCVESLKVEYGEEFFDVCLNCAGQSKVWYSWHEPQEDLISNTLLQIELIKSKLVKQNGYFVYFGSDVIFSTASQENGNSMIELNSPYSISKFAGESYTKILAYKFGYNYSIFRPSFVVGKFFSRNILFDSIQSYLGIRDYPKIHPDSCFNFIEAEKLSEYIIDLLKKNKMKEQECLASINNIYYSEILDYFKISKDNFERYDLVIRCLKNQSGYNEFFDLNLFINDYLNA